MWWQPTSLFCCCFSSNHCWFFFFSHLLIKKLGELIAVLDSLTRLRVCVCAGFAERFLFLCNAWTACGSHMLHVKWPLCRVRRWRMSCNRYFLAISWWEHFVLVEQHFEHFYQLTNGSKNEMISISAVINHGRRESNSPSTEVGKKNLWFRPIVGIPMNIWTNSTKSEYPIFELNSLMPNTQWNTTLRNADTYFLHCTQLNVNQKKSLFD